MSDFIVSVQSTLSSMNLWSELIAAAPYIGLIVVWVFGYRTVKKFIQGEAAIKKLGG